MKIGIIVPVAFLEKYASLSHYHLVLAHLVKESKKYREFYWRMSKRGDFLTLDNSSYEVGDDFFTPDELLDFAKDVGASEVMAPETYEDGLSTVEKVERFVSRIRDLDEYMPVFATIHGTTLNELELCCRRCIRAGVSTIGLSCRLRLTDLTITSDYDADIMAPPLTRLFILNYLSTRVEAFREVALHLLGLNHPFEILGSQVMGVPIRSLDTSAAFTAAVHNRDLLSLVYKKPSSREFDFLSDKFVGDWKFDGMLKHNVRVLMSLGSLSVRGR